MALLTANGKRVSSCLISMPLTGAWTADLAIDVSTAPTWTTVEIATGSLTWSGYLVRLGTFEGKTSARVVGGSGGLAKRVAPKFYRGSPASLIIGDLLREVGEQESSSNRHTMTFQKWTRADGKASAALARLLLSTGQNWRVQRDGRIWIGVDDFRAVNAAPVVVSEDTITGSQTIAQETPDLVPGVTLAGRKVHSVTHAIEPKSVRATVIYG